MKFRVSLGEHFLETVFRVSLRIMNFEQIIEGTIVRDEALIHLRRHANQIQNTDHLVFGSYLAIKFTSRRFKMPLFCGREWKTGIAAEKAYLFIFLLLAVYTDEHFSKNAAKTPYINLGVVILL